MQPHHDQPIVLANLEPQSVRGPERSHGCRAHHEATCRYRHAAPPSISAMHMAASTPSQAIADSRELVMRSLRLGQSALGAHNSLSGRGSASGGSAGVRHGRRRGVGSRRRWALGRRARDWRQPRIRPGDQCTCAVYPGCVTCAVTCRQSVRFSAGPRRHGPERRAPVAGAALR